MNKKTVKDWILKSIALSNERSYIQQALSNGFVTSKCGIEGKDSQTGVELNRMCKKGILIKEKLPREKGRRYRTIFKVNPDIEQDIIQYLSIDDETEPEQKLIKLNNIRQDNFKKEIQSLESYFLEGFRIFNHIKQTYLNQQIYQQ